MKILIDNDKFVKLSWSLKAKKNGHAFLSFSTVENFISQAESLPQDSIIFIDSHLDHGIKGEVEAHRISALGFSNIHLCTGYDDIDITGLPWIKSIVGKSCPF